MLTRNLIKQIPRSNLVRSRNFTNNNLNETDPYDILFAVGVPLGAITTLGTAGYMTNESLIGGSSETPLQDAIAISGASSLAGMIAIISWPLFVLVIPTYAIIKIN